NRQLAAIHGSKAAEAGDFPSIRTLPTLGVTYTELVRRTKLLEVVQTALTEQLEMAKTEEVKSIPSFRILDPAEVPDYRVFPKRTITVLVSTLAGFILGMIIVVLRDRWGNIDDDDPIKMLISDAWLGLRGRSLVEPRPGAPRRRNASLTDLEHR
ncbi:MAG: GNVR domain-containing protein, partial [Candidatus Dormibacteraceae bacterium]